MSRRRGYVFLVVLLVLVIGLLTVFVGVERAGTQAAIAEERVRDYQRHHEMLGFRDLLAEWLTKPGNTSELTEAARDGSVFFDAALPGNVLISARAEDAQGTVRLPDAGISDAQLLFALNDLVSRLPPERPDLVRAAGPAQVSLAGAADEVLRALAAGDSRLLEILRAMQAEPAMDSARFVTSLSTVGLSEKSAELSRVLSFNPTLFRVRLRVEDGAGVRRYSMLVDLTPSGSPPGSGAVFRGLRFEHGPGDDDPAEPSYPSSGAGRRRPRS